MFSGIRTARVVRYYPALHAADIVHEDDGWRSPRVPISVPWAATDCGSMGMPSPSPIKSSRELGSEKERLITAIVAYVGDHPVIVGFLPPYNSQMLFKDQDRYTHRVASDVYATVDAAGNTEIAHPSGAYIRIGEGTDHEDLSGKDANGKWAIKKNKNRDVNVHVQVAGSSGNSVSLTLAHDGSITINASSDMTIKAPSLNVEGNVQVNGSITATGDVRSTTVSLQTHVHGGVLSGGASTSPPI